MNNLRVRMATGCLGTFLLAAFLLRCGGGGNSNECPDNDKDGYRNLGCGGSDCNDNDNTMNPGVQEICNDLKDNNCDSMTDIQDPHCSQDGASDGGDAGSDPGTDSGSDIGSDPGSDPGADPGSDSGGDPGVDGGTDTGDSVACQSGGMPCTDPGQCCNHICCYCPNSQRCCNTQPNIDDCASIVCAYICH